MFISSYVVQCYVFMISKYVLFVLLLRSMLPCARPARARLGMDCLANHALHELFIIVTKIRKKIVCTSFAVLVIGRF